MGSDFVPTALQFCASELAFSIHPGPCPVLPMPTPLSLRIRRGLPQRVSPREGSVRRDFRWLSSRIRGGGGNRVWSVVATPRTTRFKFCTAKCEMSMFLFDRACPAASRRPNHSTRNSVFSLLQFSRSVLSDSLRPRGLQHARFPCPSPTPGACSISCPSSQ